MSTHTAVPRSGSGSISRSKPNRANSSTYITFTPETLLFAAANYSQQKDVEVVNNGQSTIMFKMKSTTADIYRIRPVYFILKSKERRTIKVTFKGLPSDRAICQRDRITAVMAFAMTNSNDVKMLWDKHRKIANQPNSSSRKYIKIDFEDERRMSLARGAPKSAAPKTNISLLTSAYPAGPDEYPPPPPPSLPRPSSKVANSGGRDASITHPNSTKKEQAIRPPSIHPSDLHPVRNVPPPLERLEPSLRTSIPLPPSRIPLPTEEDETKEETKEETMDCIPPTQSIKAKSILMKTPSRRKPPPPPSTDDSKEDTEDVPPPPPIQKKSKILPVKAPPSRRLPVVSPSEQKSTIEDETSNLKDVPSLPQSDIPSTSPSGRTNVTEEASTQQQSIVYILYPGPGEDAKSKEDADEKDEKDEESKQ